MKLLKKRRWLKKSGNGIVRWHGPVLFDRILAVNTVTLPGTPLIVNQISPFARFIICDRELRAKFINTLKFRANSLWILHISLHRDPAMRLATQMIQPRLLKPTRNISAKMSKEHFSILGRTWHFVLPPSRSTSLLKIWMPVLW